MDRFYVTFFYDDICGEVYMHTEDFETYDAAMQCVNKNWESDWQHVDIKKNNEIVFHAAKR